MGTDRSDAPFFVVKGKTPVGTDGQPTNDHKSAKEEENLEEMEQQTTK